MDTLTLQEAISRVADNVRDLTPGVTTSASAAKNQFIDTGRRGIGKEKDWVSSQVLFLQPEASASGIPDNTAFDVTGYTPGTGTFTLSRDVTTSSGVSANVPYILIRTRGQGHPFRQYIRALDWAIKKLMPLAPITFDIAPSSGVYTYAIPDNVRGIYDVIPASGGYMRPEHDWRMAPGRLLRLGERVAPDVLGATTVYAMGAPTLPTTLLGTITAEADALVDYASEYLQRGSVRPAEMQKAGGLREERLRLNTAYVPSNYVEVI